MNIEFDIPAQMRDGTVLRADVYRPEGDGPWPVLLSRLPYGKGTGQPRMVDPIRLARHGFMVVLQDTRGRFASEGEWEPWTHEENDGYDSVRWAAALPGSNGTVGMFGGSYLGNAQWMAALAKPPELKAIAPAITFSEPNDGLFARGGAGELGLTVPWSLIQGIDTVARRHSNDPATRATALTALLKDLDDVASVAYHELPAGRLPVFERHSIPDLGFQRSLREPDWTDSCRVAGRYAEIDLPSLHVGGWYDIFLQGTLDSFAAMRAAGRPANLVVGPWVHSSTAGQVGDVNFGLAASGELVGFRGSLTDLHADWFDQHLRDTTTSAAAAAGTLPPVLLFVMGSNQWRPEESWPLERAVETDYFLRAGGRLAIDAPGPDEGSDTYVYDPADPVPTTGGALQMSGRYRPGPLDQAPVESRPDVLIYDSSPLLADTEVTGRVTAILHYETDEPSTDWVVRMCDVDENGLSLNIVDGIVRVQDQDGEEAETIIDLWSTSYVFRKGHRIRVHVTSSNFPRWDRNLNTGEPSDTATRGRIASQRIMHDSVRPSRIVLPIVPPSLEPPPTSGGAHRASGDPARGSVG